MNNGEDLNTTWRKVASTIYKKPKDSKMLGGAEFDVTDLEAYIAEKRKAGLKITMTHLFVMMFSRALTTIPELNTYLKRGKIIPRKSIDVAVSVLQANGDMSSVIVPEADTKNLEQLESFLKGEIALSRRGSEKGFTQSKNLLARIPWPFRSWFFRIYKFLTLDLGLSIPGMASTSINNGSFLITNIGSLGLDYGFPALLPTSNFSFVLVMGGTQKKPVVVNDTIMIRRMMSVTIAIDHRLADASHGARLFRFIKQAVSRPEYFS